MGRFRSIAIAIVPIFAVDYVAISGRIDGRMIEYVDHLHEHFLDPVVIDHGSYRLPTRPGYSAEMRPESLARYRFPDGPEWDGGADLRARLEAEAQA